MRRELESREIATLAALAATPVPLPFKPSRGAAESYVRVRDAGARAARVEGQGHASLRIAPALCWAAWVYARYQSLPPGDVFLDLEGDAFAAEGGREYLFGPRDDAAQMVPRPTRSYWAFDDAEEQFAFESVVDLVTAKARTRRTLACTSTTTHPTNHRPSKDSWAGTPLARSQLDRLLRAGCGLWTWDPRRTLKACCVGDASARTPFKSLEPLYGL